MTGGGKGRDETHSTAEGLGNSKMQATVEHESRLRAWMAIVWFMRSSILCQQTGSLKRGALGRNVESTLKCGKSLDPVSSDYCILPCIEQHILIQNDAIREKDYER